MRSSFSLIALFSAASVACNPADRPGQGDDATAPGDGAKVGEAGAGPVQIVTPVGLYESGEGEGASQLCIVGDAAPYRFGIVRRAAMGLACSGAGSASAAPGTLMLAMDGDRACTLTGRLDGTRLTLAGPGPDGCAYYCAPGASFAGDFAKTGGDEAAAMRALDLAGDPLCR